MTRAAESDRAGAERAWWRVAWPGGLLAALALGAGCQGDWDLHRMPPGASAQATPTAPTHATAPPAKVNSGAAVVLPAEPTADDYVALALQRNRALRAAEARVRRLQARIGQVTALPDPRGRVAPVGEMAETAAGQVGTMLGLSQTFPTPGKLRTRGRIAARDVAAAREDLRRTRLRVVADVRRAYWSWYAAVRSLEVTRQSRRLLENIGEVARAKYKAGTAGQQDVLRASVALQNVDSELITLAQQRDSARAMLRRLANLPGGAPAGGWPDPPVVPLRPPEIGRAHV